MYCELFQLTEPPFRLTPDPQFLFASKQHARAKAYMESTIWLADGFVVITGDIGSGKTTLIESFLAELPDDIVLAHISQTQLSPVEFLQALLVEFGFKPFRKRKVELLSMLKDFMVEQYAAGKKILLVIDEAQNLSRKVLEEVRLLSGLELRKEKLLRIIIAGQPELSHKLDSARLQQLTQRVRLRFHLGALSKRETHEYITHRLEVAGAKGRTIFEPAACDLVFRYAGGVPRLINVLCDTALLCAFAEERTRRRRGARQSRRRGAAVGRVLRADTRARARRRRHHGPVRGQRRADGAPRGAVPRPARRRVPPRSGQDDHRPHGRQRRADPEPVRLAASRAGRFRSDALRPRGLEQHQRRVHPLAARQAPELVDGDIIQIGEHKLLYRDMRGAARRAPMRDDDDDERRRRPDEDEDDDEDELDDDEADDEHEEERRAEPSAGADARATRRRRLPRRLIQTKTPAAIPSTPTTVQIAGQYHQST